MWIVTEINNYNDWVVKIYVDDNLWCCYTVFDCTISEAIISDFCIDIPTVLLKEKQPNLFFDRNVLRFSYKKNSNIEEQLFSYLRNPYKNYIYKKNFQTKIQTIKKLLSDSYDRNYDNILELRKYYMGV